MIFFTSSLSRRATAEKRNSGQTKISNKFTVFLSKIRTDSPEWVKFTHGEFCDRLFLYVGEYNKGINRAAAAARAAAVKSAAT